MKTIISILTVVLVSIQLFAQQTITGTVTDGSSSLPVVNVVVQGTTIGVTTDFDGKYSIEVPEGSTVLEFSFVGFETQEITIVPGKTTYDIEMVEVATILNATVVSASRRKEKVLDAPASVSIINAEKIETNTAITVVDHVQYTPGVDRIQRAWCHQT